MCCFCSSSRRHPICALVTGVQTCALPICVPLPADLSTPEAAVDLVARYRQVFDGLDILVNNAGKTWGGPIDSFPDKAWPGVMAVNVQTPFKMVQELLPELTARGESGDPARGINKGSVEGERIEDRNSGVWGKKG